MQERRRVDRFQVQLDALLYPRDMIRIGVDVTTRDISAQGAFLKTSLSFQVGTDVCMDLHLPQPAGEVDRVAPLRACGKVVRLAKEGVGVAFDRHCDVSRFLAASST